MTEPERDDGAVDSGGQQPHCRGVPEHVWGDILGGQARAERRGCRGVLRQPRRDGVAAHPGSGSGGEHESVSVTWSFGGERRQDLHGLPVQGCGSVLAAFAVAKRVRTHAQMDVADLECGEFGDA